MKIYLIIKLKNQIKRQVIRKMKMELRVNQTNIEANEDGSMTVNGYVNMTEQFSEMLGRNEQFKEKISRGAFKRAIEKAKEIHFLAEHTTIAKSWLQLATIHFNCQKMQMDSICLQRLLLHLGVKIIMN